MRKSDVKSCHNCNLFLPLIKQFSVVLQLLLFIFAVHLQCVKHNIHTTHHTICYALVNEFHYGEWMVTDEND